MLRQNPALPTQLIETPGSLDHPLIIQTIRRVPSRSDGIDEAPNLSRPDPSGADQFDAEHQATDLVTGFESYGRNLWMSPWHENAAYLPP
jgi:hypothetical protein